MSRRRRQSKGELTNEGGFWRLRWREDRISTNGTLEYGWSKRVVIGPSDGAGKLTKREAEKVAWDQFLSRVNASNTPSTVCTVANFVEMKFLPQVALKKKSGQVHYRTQLDIVLNGGERKLKNCIGSLKLRDVTPDRVQMLVSEAIRAGYSTQSARHIANCVSAIFTYAEEIRWHQQANPARFVRLPEMVRKQTYSLTMEQFLELRAKLPSPAAEMLTIATLTGVRIGELLALRWGRVNFTGEAVIQGGVMLQPLSISICEQFHRGEFTAIKGAKKRRAIPLNPMALEALKQLREKATLKGPDDLVFAAPRKPLQPLDAKNIFNRVLKPLGREIGIPWINWHALRHTFSTWTDGAGISPEQRRLLLGHASIRVTSDYAHPEAESTRTAINQMVN